MRIQFDRTDPVRMVQPDPPYEVVGDLLQGDLHFSDNARANLLEWLASPGPPDKDGDPPTRSGNTVGLGHLGDRVRVESHYSGAPAIFVSPNELAWAVERWGESVKGRMGRKATVEGP
ncbi:MAG: hypothetical protein ACR2KK_03765 [Acidimicrobiales bacterium]